MADVASDVASDVADEVQLFFLIPSGKPATN